MAQPHLLAERLACFSLRRRVLDRVRAVTHRDPVIERLSPVHTARPRTPFPYLGASGPPAKLVDPIPCCRKRFWAPEALMSVRLSVFTLLAIDPSSPGGASFWTRVAARI